MKFYYAARGTFDKNSSEVDFNWTKFLQWSKLTHLSELVSADRMLNNDLVNPDWDSEEYWNEAFSESEYDTGLFRTLEYVLKQIETAKKFNLLAVVNKPEQECKNVLLDGFEFVGYDLLEAVSKFSFRRGLWVWLGKE